MKILQRFWAVDEQSVVETQEKLTYPSARCCFTIWDGKAIQTAPTTPGESSMNYLGNGESMWLLVHSVMRSVSRSTSYRKRHARLQKLAFNKTRNPSGKRQSFPNLSRLKGIPRLQNGLHGCRVLVEVEQTTFGGLSLENHCTWQCEANATCFSTFHA